MYKSILATGVILVVILHVYFPTSANGLDAASDASVQKIQYPDIAQLMMKKYQLQVEEKNFEIFYRLSTIEAVAESGTEDHDAQVISMGINSERSSLIIKLDNILNSDIMSIRFPKEVLSADKEKFTLLINGQEKGYEFSVSGKYTNLIFIVPKQTTEVEIIGTKVIPEFTGGLLILAAATSLLFVRYFGNKLRI
ncbi:hypothetical protein QVH35_04840 [Candidatus Nitrosotenuis chungbukensis]|uniref:hypothetical protein n=1 Tax=Candidatus Nitrosotenuis chungbukensis TaxID=1353246 RepID=UPI00069455CB|nr:hypothetical protein [Candidatus Nitrosotenuis chungbukensis]WKT58689.1 hypothetical protein QVH35_04840 [Candidatus Nitrosotenuis chungbukensis]